MAQVRGLERFLKDEQFLHAGKLDVLHGTTLAFDAVTYFQSLLPDNALHLPMGGISLDLTSAVDKILAQLTNLNITPIFIFPGLENVSIGRNEENFKNNCWSAWQNFSRGNAKTAAFNFSEAGGWSINVENAIFNYLNSNKITVLRAPGSVHAQIGYLCQPGNSIVHGCVGPSAMMLYGADRVISSLSWSNNRTEWTQLTEILNGLGLSQKEFIEVCLLAGNPPLVIIKPLIEIALITLYSPYTLPINLNKPW